MKFLVKLMLAAIIMVAGCKVPQRPTTVLAQVPNANVQLTNPADTKIPPTVNAESDDVVINAPPKTEITVVEYAPQPAPESPQQETKRTTIKFPETAGAPITVKKSKVSASGSAGNPPPPPPTPFEKSTSYWNYVGIGIFALGIFFMTPWGGNHWRVGLLISGGGVLMALLGMFLNEISQWAKYKMPGWLPAIGFLGIVAGILLYYGYRVRHNQQPSEPQTK